MKLIKIILSIGLVSLISACGGGGGGGGGGAADITTDNAQKLSIAATESTRQAVNTDAAGSASPFGFKTSSNAFDVEAFSEKLSRQVQRSADLQFSCDSGSYATNLSGNSGNGSITFNSCSYLGAVLSGTVTFNVTTTSFTYVYTNFTVTYNGFTQTLDYTLSCTDVQNEFNCTSSSSITGIDGRNYAVSNINVTSNFDSSYDVTADVVDPEFGTISINAQSIAFECTGNLIDRPSSGTITFTSNGISATVMFNSCNSYTVTVNGVSNLYSWIVST